MYRALLQMKLRVENQTSKRLRKARQDICITPQELHYGSKSLWLAQPQAPFQLVDNISQCQHHASKRQ